MSLQVAATLCRVISGPVLAGKHNRMDLYAISLLPIRFSKINH